MKNITKIRYIVILLTLIIIVTNNAVFVQAFTYGGIDYINTKGEVVSFGGNLWNDNHSKGTTIFPLSEAWSPVEVGLTDGQPLIIDGVIFTLGNKKITAIEKETGKLLNTIDIQYIYPHFNSGSLFAIKHSDTKYQLISPSKDGKVISLNANIVRNSDNSIVGLNFSPNWQFNVTQLTSESLRLPQILTQNITILKDSNATLNKVYVGFGTYTGNMIVLDSSTGNTVVNGNLVFDSILGSSGGITYRNFADIILPSNKGTSGGFIGGTVQNGVLNLNVSIKNNVHNEGVIGPMAYAVINNSYTGASNGMLIAQDKVGSIIGYNTTEQELLFIIDKYAGTSTINSIAIAGKYLLITYGEDKNGKSKVVCVNYETAVEAGQYHPDKLANESISFEENFDAHTYSGAIALSVAEQEFDSFGNIKETIYREVFMMANRATNPGVKNVQMYYLDQYNSANKRPISVPYAFQVEETVGVFRTKNGLHIAEGIVSQLSYGGGYLVFVDGKGYIHAYTAAKINNLALVNFENSSTLLERGKTYQSVVDVVNYTGEYQENVSIEFWINDEKVHEGRISFGADGITVNFQYTVPENYDKELLKIDAKLNMKIPRVLEETTYDDNIATLMMDVPKLEELDLEVTRITHSSFFKGQYGMVNVQIRNNSDKTIRNPKVPVRLQIADTTLQLVKSVNLAPKATSTVSFKLQVPDTLMSFIIVGEINHTRVYEETNYINNRKQITANIINPSLIPGCTPTSTTWTEYRGVDEYSSGGIVAQHFENRFSHYEYEEDEYEDEFGNITTSSRSYAVYVLVLVGYTVRFNASIHGTMSVNPQTIKAGYGIAVEAETWVNTNYDMPYLLTNVQNIYAHFPDRSTPVMLVPQGDTGSIATLKWTLPANPQSVFGEKKHYIPVQWSDGPYKINLNLQNVDTPGDTLCRDLEQTIAINGQMYEDDHTGIGR